MKKTTPTRRVRSDATPAHADPYKPARRPVRGERTERGERSERPTRSFERSERPARPTRSAPTRSARPTRAPRDADAGPRYGARRFGGSEDRGERSERSSSYAERGSGFTVNLDPDVARVFRGDASVNKALRLVLQLMQVVQGPAPRFGGREGGREGGRFGSEGARSGGYRGSPEARGFERKPRFEEDEESE